MKSIILCIVSFAPVTFWINAHNDPLILPDRGFIEPPRALGRASEKQNQVTKSTVPTFSALQSTKSAVNPSDINHQDLERESFEELFARANGMIQQGKTEDAILVYQHAIKKRADLPEPYCNLGIAYLALKKQDDAIAVFKTAVEKKPSYVKARLLLGRALMQAKQSDAAQEHFRKVLEYDTEQWEAHAAIGRWLASKERFQEALPFFKRASELNAKDIQLRFEYANTLNTLNQFDESLTIYHELLKRMPESVSILYNIAYTYKQCHRIEEAMHYYDAVIKRSPDHAEAQFSRGLAHIMLGNWQEGWRGYEWRWKRGPNKPVSLQLIHQPMWDGISDLQGKTILLTAEQGFGDTFQFIRFAKEIKQRGPKKVIVYVQQRIKKVCAQLCSSYIDEIVDLQPRLPSFDTWAALPSLPHILGITPETCARTVPYLHPDKNLILQWREMLSTDTNFKVGICWQGNNNYQTPFLRAVVSARPIELEKLMVLAAIPGVSLYSLQKNDGLDQIKKLSGGTQLKTFGDTFDSTNGAFVDTAAVMKNLDLIITIDTSIAHLAGGLGVPTWVLLAKPADWRWMLDGESSPFYPTMRLFRQQDSGDWDPVITRVTNELRSLVVYYRMRRKES